MATPQRGDDGSSGWERLRNLFSFLRGSPERDPDARKPALDRSRFWAELHEGEQEAAREAETRGPSSARDPSKGGGS